MPELIRGNASRIDELEPLWLSLRAHHGSVTPEWGPLHPAGESWAVRSETYRELMADGGAMFLAVDGAAVIGYAICEEETWRSPTWQWPANFLSIVDLIVLPAHRGEGIGVALLTAVEDEARSRGLDAVDMNAAAPNQEARLFYEKHGYRLDLVTYRKPLD
jgi:ribosomal protein S18 acetylase RimI-like enzyme